MVEKSASVPLLTTSSLCSELCAGIIAQAGPKKATAREYNSLWARKLQTGLILHTHYGDPESESSCSTRRSSPMRRECINTCRSDPRCVALAYPGPDWWFLLHMIQSPMVGLVTVGLWLLVSQVLGVDGVSPSRLLGCRVRRPWCS